MRRRTLTFATVAALAAIAAPANGGDRVTVSLDPALGPPPKAGRLILFFVTETHPRWPGVTPLHGPFIEVPQPIASTREPVHLAEAPIAIDLADFAGGERIDALDGRVLVQAVLDLDATGSTHLAAGNLYSEVLDTTLSASANDALVLTLRQRVPSSMPATDQENLRWVSIPSSLLGSEVEPVQHQAGIALPKGYFDPEQAARRWPAIYVIPGFGEDARAAVDYADLHAMPGSEAVTPQAVFIVLDPQSAWGHHGFVDSPNHGPRRTALVEELIPHLEAAFRLRPEPSGRIVTGHGAGGWSALWLQFQHPETFGACWAIAPDPIDFTAFQTTDLYRDENLLVDPSGRPRPAYRRQVGRDREAVRMTVRQEVEMERALAPGGGSGQRWDSWEARYSPRDPLSQRPRPLMMDHSGRIDPAVVEHWSRFDITRLVRERWDRYGPIVTGRIRLICGKLDSFYLHLAVERFKALVDERAGTDWGPGYVWLVEDATFNNVGEYTFIRVNKEMMDYLHAADEGARAIQRGAEAEGDAHDP